MKTEVIETSRGLWLIRQVTPNGVTTEWGPFDEEGAWSRVTKEEWDARITLDSIRCTHLTDRLKETECLLMESDKRVAAMAAERDRARQQVDDLTERAKRQFLVVAELHEAMKQTAVEVAVARGAAVEYREMYMKSEYLDEINRMLESDQHIFPWETE